MGGSPLGGSDAGNAGYDGGGSASNVVPDGNCVWALPKTGRANGGATVGALGGNFDDLASMSLRSFDRVSKLSVFALCFVRRLLTGDGRLENMKTTPQ